ncbi:MAG: hypothetical protein LBB80_04760 [Treponema sp.]|nr:hypothetical protein [Treponema sp.]
MKKIWGVIYVLVLGLSMKTYPQSSASANFGNYPADYGIAYLNMAGFTRSLTVRDLFGSSAPWITTFQSIPSIVTLDSTSGDSNKFSAVFTLTLQVPETGQEFKVFRMQVEFRSDNFTEKSYVRYVKSVNMMSGEIEEKRSYGNQMDDANICGYFIGMMAAFWDMEKLKP